MNGDERRIEQNEARLYEIEQQQAELVVVVMGPGPNHDNGLRGDFKELKAAFYRHKEEALQEGNNVRVAKIQAKSATWAQWCTLAGVLIMAAAQVIAALKGGH